tara:strand:+ start:420 stop:923 length:504 start_codon:yes stop_codon:yes gene_type:complete
MKALLINIIIFSLAFNMNTVENLDIDRFMGKWYVISNIPNFVEKGCKNAYDIYTLNSDNTVDVLYYAIKDKEEFTIKQNGEIVDKVHNSTWKMRFTKPYIPFYRAPYEVIILDEEYEYMVIGYPGNTYGWIMSRNNYMDESLYQNILNTLKNNFGYNKEDFKRVLHD